MRHSENWICTTPWCSAEQWLVQAEPRQRDVWHIAPATHGRSWTVAASQPICPLCGVDLAPAPVLVPTLDAAEYEVRQLARGVSGSVRQPN